MLFFALFLLIVFLLSIVGYTWYRLHKSMHLHATAGDKKPADYGLAYDSMTFTARDDVSLSGWYIPVKNPKAVIILVHGRALRNSGKSMMLPIAADLYKHGYATFLFDMRSTGESKGEVIDFGSKQWQDAAAAYTYAKSLLEDLPAGRQVKALKIGFLGISQGATASLIAAGKEHVGDFVIAITPFATHASLFAYQVQKENVFPKFLFRWALQIAANIELGLGYELYNALHFVPLIKAATFFVSAKQDSVVNPKDAWTLYESAQKPKEFWEAESGHDVYGEKKEEFMDKILHFLSVYIA